MKCLLHSYKRFSNVLSALPYSNIDFIFLLSSGFNYGYWVVRVLLNLVTLWTAWVIWKCHRWLGETLLERGKLRSASAPVTSKACNASLFLVVTFCIFDFCPKGEKLVSKKKARSKRCWRGWKNNWNICCPSHCLKSLWKRSTQHSLENYSCLRHQWAIQL